MSISSKRGFTLIELLVVIAIIGLLASVVIASLNSARQKGRDARRIADVKSIQLALEMFFDARGTYPSSTAQLQTGGFMGGIPVDPSTSAAYPYAGNDTNGNAGNCESYHLGATLENTTHSALTGDDDTAAATACTGSTDFAGTDPVYAVKP